MTGITIMTGIKIMIGIKIMTIIDDHRGLARTVGVTVGCNTIVKQ
jgi:hypothetical protein